MVVTIYGKAVHKSRMMSDPCQGWIETGGKGREGTGENHVLSELPPFITSVMFMVWDTR